MGRLGCAFRIVRGHSPEFSLRSRNKLRLACDQRLARVQPRARRIGKHVFTATARRFPSTAIAVHRHQGSAEISMNTRNGVRPADGFIFRTASPDARALRTRCLRTTRGNANLLVACPMSSSLRMEM